ncbi:16S rRNA (uracil(1498)-N(3))-methyltransferase [Geminicoccaceae bacterium 1502E]|nr:16S rRNA (uracil(1498)-N(3))-methyltransferase [Geminicoccaceae bacterium 1502E]
MTTPRLHLAMRLEAGATVRLEAERAHYLVNVLRLKPGAEVRLFNVASGEWAASILEAGRHNAVLELADCLRPPASEPGPVLHFAPIRLNRMEWLVEKAVELGASRLVPLITRRTVVKLGKPQRLAAIATEAAEQCERLEVPEVDEPQPLKLWLEGRGEGERIAFADERGEGPPLADVLAGKGPHDLLIGPEGGFDARERELLLGHPAIIPVSLGPRILRAETAALFALSCWQVAAVR